MSTKNLARTVIEGGRRNGYKYERKQSLKNHRRGCKALLQGSRNPVEDFEDVDFPERQDSTYWKDEKFNDKISPVERWLEKQVGRSWDKVYSLLRERFDIRTTPGRHIVFDHLLNQVWTSQDHTTRRSEYHEYYVDGYGVLRKNPEYPYRYGYTREDWKKIHAEQTKISQWLDGRLIGKVGEVLYWFEPTRPIPSGVYLNWGYGGFEYYFPSNLGFKRKFYTPYRQGVRMNGKDVEFFKGLHERNKEDLLENSPLVRKYSGHGPFFY